LTKYKTPTAFEKLLLPCCGQHCCTKHTQRSTSRKKLASATIAASSLLASAFAACMHSQPAPTQAKAQPDKLKCGKRTRHHLASATIAASSLLASAFTSGAAAEGGAAMAGVGAAMTANAA
jgi:hypothetical protein